MQSVLTENSKGVQQHTAAGSPMLRKLLRFNPQFNLHRTGSSDRGDIEDYIAEVFAQAYNAEVTGFAPFLISMRCAGNISAAAGIQPANTAPLFLEQYLDNPIEQVLSSRYGKTIGRHEIFELCNLAALRPGVTQLIYLIMAGVMARTGLDYAVFAGTKQVAKGVSKLGFCMESIVAADPARLGADAANWGSYYANEPHVMVLDVRKSMAAINALPLPGTLLSMYESQIAEMAKHFNSVHRATSPTNADIYASNASHAFN
jgi:hypothetical protein